MKIQVTNTDKQPVERFGKVFKKDTPVPLEVTRREYLALRAVRTLKVEIVPEKSDRKSGANKTGGKPADSNKKE